MLPQDVELLTPAALDDSRHCVLLELAAKHFGQLNKGLIDFYYSEVHDVAAQLFLIFCQTFYFILLAKLNEAIVLIAQIIF
jgi:hypothetical protein